MWAYNSLYLSHANRASTETGRNTYRAAASAYRLGSQNTKRIDDLVTKTEPIGRYAVSINRYYKQIMQLSSEIRQLFNQLSQEAVRYDQGSPSLSENQGNAKGAQLTGKINALNTAIANLSNVLSDAGKSGANLADFYIDAGDLIGLRP
jgi:hypothetical protein